MSNQQEWRGDSDGPRQFDPVALRARHDGWTPARQVAFIRLLGESACVVEACRAVGMSSQSAYALRARAGAFSFREAWDAALDFAMGRAAEAAVGRAVNGVVTPIFYKGEKVGERRHFDERLTMFLLRTRAPHRYGRAAEEAAAEEYPEENPGEAFEYAIERLSYDAEKEERDLEGFEPRKSGERAAPDADAAHMAPSSPDASPDTSHHTSRPDDPRPDVWPTSSTSAVPAGSAAHAAAPHDPADLPSWPADSS